MRWKHKAFFNLRSKINCCQRSFALTHSFISVVLIGIFFFGFRAWTDSFCWCGSHNSWRWWPSIWTNSLLTECSDRLHSIFVWIQPRSSRSKQLPDFVPKSLEKYGSQSRFTKQPCKRFTQTILRLMRACMVLHFVVRSLLLNKLIHMQFKGTCM